MDKRRANFRAERYGMPSGNELREWSARETDYMREQGATWFELRWIGNDTYELLGWYVRPADERE